MANKQTITFIAFHNAEDARKYLKELWKLQTNGVTNDFFHFTILPEIQESTHTHIIVFIAKPQGFQYLESKSLFPQ